MNKIDQNLLNNNIVLPEPASPVATRHSMLTQCRSEAAPRQARPRRSRHCHPCPVP